MSKYGVISGPYFTAFGLNEKRYEVSLRIQSECGKIRTRNNSVFGHLSLSANFREISSLIGTPTNKLAKFLLPFLTSLTENKPSQINSILLKKFVTNLYVASLNVDYLSSNIFLDKTFDICMDSFCKDNENTPRIPKDVLRNFLNLAIIESYSILNNKFYK